MVGKLNSKIANSMLAIETKTDIKVTIGTTI